MPHALCRRNGSLLGAALVLAGTVLAGTGLAEAAQATDPIDVARTLYAEASYDEALAALEGLDGVEADQYRALCLLALGRMDDAHAALADIVHAAPGHVLTDAEVPPRLVQMFADTRRRVLPDAVRSLFATGWEHATAGAFDAARDAFLDVLALLDDPALHGWAGAGSLARLASGQLEMMAAARRAEESEPMPTDGTPPAPAAEAAAPAPSEEAEASTPAKDTPASTSTEHTPAPAAGPARTVVVQAAVIRQNVPPYTGLPGASVTDLSGAVRITIGTDGLVTAASIERSIDPRYDARLLAAVRDWSYRPATRDGRPIPSERVVEIRVRAD